ncbi:MAG TPA: ABC transporter substrate-binding protein [Candidatus Binatia bacterium]
MTLARTLALAAVCLAVGIQHGIAAEPARLTAGYSTNTAGQSVLWVAKDAGLFEKNGLAVNLVFIQSAFLMTQALIAGDVPIAAMGGGGAVASQLAGSDLVIIASLAKSPNLNYLVTRKDIARPEQLKGKRLGVARLGGASDATLRLALNKIGLDADKDVTILQIGLSPARIRAIESGAIDGTILTVEERAAAGTASVNVLLDLKKLGLEVLSNDIVAPRRFLREHEETSRAFVKALADGIHYYKSNKSRALDIMTRYMRGAERRTVEAGYDFNAEVYQRKPYPSREGVRIALEELAPKNPKAAAAKPEQFIDDRFVRGLDGYIDTLYRN